MAQQMQTTVKADEAAGRVRDEHTPTEDRSTRLQVLIAELLIENQKLRYKVAHLERRTCVPDGVLVEGKD